LILAVFDTAITGLCIAIAAARSEFAPPRFSPIDSFFPLPNVESKATPASCGRGWQPYASNCVDVSKGDLIAIKGAGEI
jgi:hypothetical protein